MAQRYDGKTGRPLYPQTPEERRAEILRAIEGIKRWDREHVWWRRMPRDLMGRIRVLLRWGTR